MKVQSSELEISRVGPKIAILNPYVPKYRSPFFEGLKEKLASVGIELVVVTGKPSKDFLERNDFETLTFQKIKEQLSVRIGSVLFRYLRCKEELDTAEAVVYEYSVTNLNSWKAVLGKRNHKIVLWGHGPGYLSPSTKLKDWLQKLMANRADLVLSYTELGKERIVKLGVPATKVFSVNNSVDTESLKSRIASVTESTLGAFRTTHGLDKHHRIACFLGALDSSKRIPFLVKVLDQIWLSDPNFKLLVGGDGPMRQNLARSIKRGQTIWLGRVGDEEKAIFSRIASCIVNPGNTGLLAVDSLTMRIPILGTAVRSSPEKDYLAEGSSFITLPNDPALFATELLEFLANPRKEITTEEAPSMNSFIQNFFEALVELPIQKRGNKLLFVTNLPAPYRLSLFEELSNNFNLTVAYTGWRDEGRQWAQSQDSYSKYKSEHVARLIGWGPVKIPFPRRTLKHLIQDSDFVITGGWHSPTFMYSLYMARKSPAVSCLWFESTLDSARFRSGVVSRVRRTAFHLARLIFVPGASSEIAASRYSKGSRPIVILNNPISKEFSNPNRGFAIKPNDKAIGTRYLYFGRLISRKKVDILINAFENIATKQDFLTIIGSGPEEKTIRRRILSSRVKSQIMIHPAVGSKDAVDIYKNHDVLVLPSVREVRGLVVPEALFLGLQVVASDSVGCVPTFRRFGTLSTFRENDVSELERRMGEARTGKTLSSRDLTELRKIVSTELFADRLSSALAPFQEASIRIAAVPK